MNPSKQIVLTFNDRNKTNNKCPLVFFLVYR